MATHMKTKEPGDLITALTSNDIIAEVIKFSATWEAALDNYLAIEFGGTSARFGDFIELVAPNINFDRKIEALRKMSFPRETKSRTKIVTTLSRIRKIRNKLAHAHDLDSTTIAKIQSDRALVAFILGYPASFTKEGKALQNWFSHLWRSWEVRLQKDRAYWTIWIAQNPGWGYERYLPKAES
jgi:hypothetical protein